MEWASITHSTCARVVCHSVLYNKFFELRKKKKELKNIKNHNQSQMPYQNYRKNYKKNYGQKKKWASMMKDIPLSNVVIDPTSTGGSYITMVANSAETAVPLQLSSRSSMLSYP